MPDAAAAASPAQPAMPVRSPPLSMHNTPLPLRGTLLGFDFGLARIGVATGELETGQASALLTLHDESSTARFQAITKLIAEWRPVALVVGIPTHLDDSEHALTARCRRFANQLHGRFGLPVFPYDERLSSVTAESELSDAGLKGWRERKAVLDAAAARLILQTFLDALRHDRT